ncbi:hypothetical protein ES703_56770 [subsurface metagenome]
MNMKQRIFCMFWIVVGAIPVGLGVSEVFETPFYVGHLVAIGTIGVFILCVKLIDPIIEIYQLLGDKR